MRQMNEICPIGECINYLGLDTTATDADRALIQMLKDDVEDDARQYVGHGISQPTADYIEFHPKTDRMMVGNEFVDLIGDKVTTIKAAHKGDKLYLDNWFVRSVTEIREDTDAFYGQEADDFDSSTILTEGTDFALVVDEVDASGTTLSITGCVERMVALWPAKAGTVKVTYNAGLTASELDNQYRWVKGVIREEVATRFKMSKSSSGTDGGAGPIKRFAIGGQVMVEYGDTAVKEMTSRELMGSTRRKLNKIRRLPLWG